jgi:hypothetical protein
MICISACGKRRERKKEKGLCAKKGRHFFAHRPFSFFLSLLFPHADMQIIGITYFWYSSLKKGPTPIPMLYFYTRGYDEVYQRELRAGAEWFTIQHRYWCRPFFAHRPFSFFLSLLFPHADMQIIGISACGKRRERKKEKGLCAKKGRHQYLCCISIPEAVSQVRLL